LRQKPPRRTTPLQRAKYLYNMQIQRSTPLVFGATIAGESANVMIDSGSNRSYISPTLAKKLDKQRKKKAKPYPLIMADGTPAEYDGGWIRYEISDAELNLEGHRETITLDILPTKFDIILGIEWLQRHTPMIDWKQRTLTFPNCSHGKEAGRRSNPDEPIRAIWV